MRNRGWTAAGSAAGLGGLALLLAACGSSGTNMNAGAAYGGSSMGATPSSSMSGGGTTSGMGTKTVSLTIKTTKIGKVLTDAQGDTLYFYSKDTKDGPSTCTGACAAAWPQVVGKAVAAPGVKFAGVLGSVTDSGGAIQATYNGYPLYTYKADMAPGQTAGNGEGGVWHVISGTTLTAAPAGGMSSPSATKSSSGMGGGYGSGYGTGTKVSSATGSSGSKGSTTHTTPAAPPSTAPAAPPSTPAAPAPAPSSTINGGGCGEGACW
jgi:predicted lipoprotein with Yx(FWY)xxD motif